MLCKILVYSKVLSYIYIFLYRTLFHYKLLQDIEYSSLCYMVYIYIIFYK